MTHRKLLSDPYTCAGLAHYCYMCAHVHVHTHTNEEKHLPSKHEDLGSGPRCHS